MKRFPIKKQVGYTVQSISLIALILAGLLGYFSISRLKDLSDRSLISQAEQALVNSASNQAEIIDLNLSKYSDYISLSLSYIDRLYEDSDEFQSCPVLPPDAFCTGISMQRYLRDEGVALEDIEDELYLMGNLETLWQLFMEEENNYISAVYIGTESGFMMCYDAAAALGAAEGGGEVYYDFSLSDWYTTGKTGSGITFTNIYEDAFLHTPIISCVSPFYNNGEFKGVVCMDIMIKDLQKAAVGSELSNGIQVFLADKVGNIIASSLYSNDVTSLDTLYDSDSYTYEIADKITIGESGVEYSSAGYYVAYSAIDSADWILCIAVPESVILDSTTDMEKSIAISTRTFIFDFIIVMVLVIIATVKFSGNLVKPLAVLQDDVGKITGGDLDHIAVKLNNDEIGDLAEAFNGMTASLKQQMAELTAVTAEKERIGAELSIATNIQASMLPSIFPPFPDRKEFDIFASMNPAKEVGGDFYDFFMVDEKHLAVVVADVSGKGVPAALFMVIGKTLIKDHTEPGIDLGTVFTKVNSMLCESNSEELFITAFEFVLDLETGELNYVNAGHNPPLLKKSGEPYDYLRTRPALVLAGMDGMRYKSGTMQLNPGDEIFLYTDGVTEATDINTGLYGEDRLKAMINSRQFESAKELCVEIKADVDAFVGEADQFDDITMLSLKFNSYLNG